MMPDPSAETVALEGSLLTLDDVGENYTEEYRGSVGVSGGKVCPESDFEFTDAGMMRAAFVWELGDGDQVELVEMVRVGEPDELDALFPAIRSAFEVCSGTVWTDYGDTRAVEILPTPDIGDDRIAALVRHGDPPFEGRHDHVRTMYVRTGEIFVEISISEPLDGFDQEPSVDGQEFTQLVTSAIARLQSR